MSFLSKIRSHFFDAHLKTKLSLTKINRTSVEFDMASSIGILFDATNPVHRNKVMQYADTMKKHGKKVDLLGFVKSKQKELSLPYKFFTLREVDWKMIPESAEINQFIRKKFDILINLYLPNGQSVFGKDNPIKYISALSKANLRVGPFTQNINYFDLIIDTPDGTDLDHLIKQVDFFLNRINSPVYETAV